MKLLAVLETRSVIVCCGTGGVGKTTVSAAIALSAAQLGRRVCVVTIDPARRLADALGIETISDTPHRIEGPWPGQLDAVMLDAHRTFDRIVSENARDDEQASQIFANRLYRNLVSALSGTQEYMATEELYQLRQSGKYDLIVVDTPPSRDALDFLAAPQRLAGFLDNRVFRLLLVPGRAGVRAMNVASQVLLRTIGKVAGQEIVEDTIAFFRAFDGMEQGFRDRATAVDQLLRDEGTSFVLVTTPRRDALVEADYFATQLASSGQSIELVVVNRMHPDFGSPPSSLGSGDTSWSSLLQNLEELASITERERALVSSYLREHRGASLVEVPLLPDDVHDVPSLQTIARLLVAEALP